MFQNTTLKLKEKKRVINKLKINQKVQILLKIKQILYLHL